jgi:DNA polymerase III sliding clamp (beta) subunit (PCNA family)
MPRFFFNVHFDDHVARDPIGLEVPDLAEAVKEAEKARTEIMHEDELDRLWLEIVDEKGRTLATVGPTILKKLRTRND